MTGPDARMGNTVLARVGHIVSCGNASLTGRIAYGQDWGRRLFPFQGLFSIHGQRRGVVFLVFKPESERGHDLKAQYGAILIDTASAWSRIFGTHDKGDAFHAVAEIRIVEKGLGDSSEHFTTQYVDMVPFHHGFHSLTGRLPVQGLPDPEAVRAVHCKKVPNSSRPCGRPAPWRAGFRKPCGSCRPYRPTPPQWRAPRPPALRVCRSREDTPQRWTGRWARIFP